MSRMLRCLPFVFGAVVLNLMLFGDMIGSAVPERAAAPAVDVDDVERIVVVGLDGVDFHILDEYIRAGHLPEFARLVAEGSMRPLTPEMPPESPVSWSSLLTGRNPGNHGVFDFIRVGDDYAPLNGMVDIKRVRLFLQRIPLRPPRLKSRLRAPTFIERVRDAGYPVLSLRQPLLFPAPTRPGGRFTTGLGTPDVAGTAGYAAAYSNRVAFGSGTTTFGVLQVPLEGGIVATSFDTALYGPFDPTLGRDPRGARRRASVPLRFQIEGEAEDAVVTITLGDQRAELRAGERSDFLPVTFDVGFIPPVQIDGIVRFEVKQTKPLFVLASPVNFDPRSAPFPITTPPEYGEELWNRYGSYETVGWQEETFALNDRFQDDKGFLKDLLEDMDRGAGILLGEMDRGEKLLFSVFTATDRACHAFFRYRDKGHPLYAERDKTLGDPILTVFQSADHILGKLRERLGPEDTLLVVSDHGFQTWRWAVNVNQWLVDNGYMVLTSDQEAKSLDHVFAGLPGADVVDWSRTRAFAMGLGQVYINTRGRYKQGIVAPGDVDALASELQTKLLAMRNPYVAEGATDGVGHRALESVTRLRDLYFGRFANEAPDLQLGFSEGYRVSWQTALLGGMRRGGDVFVRNRYPWSGDHCSTEQKLVPGVLLSNRKIPAAPAGYHVRDIAATVLEHFGIDHSDLDGEARAIPIEDR